MKLRRLQFINPIQRDMTYLHTPSPNHDPSNNRPACPATPPWRVPPTVRSAHNPAPCAQLQHALAAQRPPKKRLTKRHVHC
jgi:hypothetical protein